MTLALFAEIIEGFALAPIINCKFVPSESALTAAYEHAKAEIAHLETLLHQQNKRVYDLEDGSALQRAEAQLDYRYFQRSQSTPSRPAKRHLWAEIRRSSKQSKSNWAQLRPPHTVHIWRSRR